MGVRSSTRIVDPDKVRIVANRVARGGEREIGDLIRKHLGKRPAAYVPDEPAAFRAAIGLGRAVREMGSGRIGSDCRQVALRFTWGPIGASGSTHTVGGDEMNPSPLSIVEDEVRELVRRQG